MLATSAGIGLFLAFTGLQATQGLGLSVYSTTTAVTIGARIGARCAVGLHGPCRSVVRALAQRMSYAL